LTSILTLLLLLLLSRVFITVSLMMIGFTLEDRHLIGLEVRVPDSLSPIEGCNAI
jgi:hypothetical protein